LRRHDGREDAVLSWRFAPVLAAMALAFGLMYGADAHAQNTQAFKLQTYYGDYAPLYHHRHGKRTEQGRQTGSRSKRKSPPAVPVPAEEDIASQNGKTPNQPGGSGSGPAPAAGPATASQVASPAEEPAMPSVNVFRATLPASNPARNMKPPVTEPATTVTRSDPPESSNPSARPQRAGATTEPAPARAVLPQKDECKKFVPAAGMMIVVPCER